jgi:hypothetical protein
MLLDQFSIHAWLVNNKIKTEMGKTLDFSTHRYLFDIYIDESKYLCCSKAGQIGFSTMGILKTLWLARFKKLDVGYILPTVDMVQKFVGSKVNRMAQQNPAIELLLKDKDSISQKQIGENYIHYLGAMTDRSAIMLSLDMLVADEYDKAPQDILEIYDSRLQHSNFGYKWVFSNPTKPDWGVSGFMDKSDYKSWNITHSCGKTYPMEENCIDYKLEKYICPHCKTEIIDEERRMGEWYNRDGVKWTGKVEEGYTWSGWWIPLWIVPQVSASVIADHKKTKSPEYFANFVAGLPYLNTNDALSQALLEQNLVPRVNDQTGRIIIGVDTGHNIHYVIGNKQGIFYHGYINSVAENEASHAPIEDYDPYNELDRLLVRFPTSILIADQAGDLIGIRKLQAKYKGRVFLCFFTKETRTQQLIRWSEGKEYGKVMVDRNRAIQLVVDEIKDRRFPIWGTKEDWQPYFTHWLNIYRVREIKGEAEDPQYDWRWIWKRKGADHLALATIYMRVGLDRFGQDLATVINKDAFDGIPTADKPFRIPSQYRQMDI